MTTYSRITLFKANLFKVFKSNLFKRSFFSTNFFKHKFFRTKLFKVLLVAAAVGGTSLVMLVGTSLATMNFQVNSTGDEGDSLPGDHICLTVRNTCTLRAAIEEANATSNGFNSPVPPFPGFPPPPPPPPPPDTITFATADTFTITPTSALPEITEAVDINGLGNGLGKVRLDGLSAGLGVNGLTIATDSGSKVRGLAILNFSGSGVIVSKNASPTSSNLDPNTISDNNISGNRQSGVFISGSGTPTGFPAAHVTRNTIGVNPDPTADSSAGSGNAGDGIKVTGAYNFIGEGNIIRDNEGSGVLIYGSGATNNRVVGNSIFSNDGLGINLVGELEGANGVTKNDSGDGDAGPNNLQNYPELTRANKSASGTTMIEGKLNSTANTSFTVQFFSSPQADPSGYGEGRTYLGQKTVTTDSSGNTTFTFDTTDTTTPATGEFVAATATSPSNDISEFSTAIKVDLTQDTTPPAAPSVPDLDPSSDTGSSSTDNITNDATPTINGVAEAGSTVELFDVRLLLPDASLGTAAADDLGSWSITTDMLADGVHELKAVSTDGAGNSSVDSGRLSIMIDTQAPGAPQNLQLDPGSDTGSSGDNTTSDTTPTITGTADADSIVKIFTGTSSPGTTTVDGSGNWRFTVGTALGTPLESGTYSITAKAIDKAGNTSEESTPPLSVTIEANEPSGTQGPGKIVFVSDRSATQGDPHDIHVMGPDGSGLEQLGRPGEELSPAISPDGEKIAYADFDTNAVYVMNSDGSGQDVKVIDKVNDFFLLSDDYYLAWSPDSTKLAVHGHSYDPISSTSDIFTINADGTGQPTNVTNSDDAGESYPSWSSDGKIAFISNNPSGSSEYANNSTTDIYVISADGSGQRTNLTNTNQRWENFPSWSPDASQLAYTALEGSETYGEYEVFKMKANGTEQIRLTDTAGYEEMPSWSPNGTKLVFSAQRDSQTNYTYDIFTINADGSAESNVTLDSKSYLTVGNEYSLDKYARWGPYQDNRPPAKPAAPTLDSTTDSGTPGDGITSFTQSKINGTAEGGSTVSIYKDGVLDGTATAAPDGSWSYTFGTLAQGTYSITVKAADAAGNTSAESDALTLKVDTTIATPAAPDLDDASDLGSSSTDNITSDTTPGLSGTGAEAGSTLTVYATDSSGTTTTLGTDEADSSGAWSVTPTTALGSGTYTITVKATDAAGNTSSASSGLSITIDSSKPDAPSITSPADGSYNNTGIIELRGTAEKYSIVDIYDDSSKIATVTASDTGNWSYTVSGLSDATHSFTATATDAAGNPSAASSAAVSITVDKTGVPSAPVILSPTSGSYTKDNTPTISGTAENGTTVELHDSNNTKLGETTADGQGNWSFTPSDPLTDGNYTYKATAKDTAGNLSGYSNSVTLTVDTAAPTSSATAKDSAANSYASGTWTNKDVTVELDVGDGSGSGTNATYYRIGNGAYQPYDPTQKIVVSSEGEHTISYYSTDRAGNQESPPETFTVKLDKTKPIVDITNAPTEGEKVDICAPGGHPNPSFTASDALSGIATQSGSLTTKPPAGGSGAGNYTYSATASDRANNSDTVTRNYSVVYDTDYTDTSGAYSGLSQPINLGSQRSSFKLGSTIPVSFTLSCNGTPINKAVAKLYLSKVDSSADAVNEAVSTNSPDIGNQFRVVDTATGKYQFNLSTKAGYSFPAPNGGTVSLGQGTWYLFIELDDGGPKFRAAAIDIKK